MDIATKNMFVSINIIKVASFKSEKTIIIIQHENQEKYYNMFGEEYSYFNLFIIYRGFPVLFGHSE